MKMVMIGDSVASLDVRQNADNTGLEVEVWTTKRKNNRYYLMGCGVFGLPSNNPDAVKFYSETIYPLYKQAPLLTTHPTYLTHNYAKALKRAEAHLISHRNLQSFDTKQQSILPEEGLLKMLGAGANWMVLLAAVDGVKRITIDKRRTFARKKGY